MNKEIFGKRYQVLEKIGEGGMGRVYKVYDTVREKNLALKEMSRSHVESPVALLRFKNEFRIMSEFMHPDTVRVYDFGTTTGKTPFMTMEYIEGKNLSELSNLSVEQVVDLLIKLARALGYIHSRLYVHRDLKPDNIKMLEDGSINLLDYGLMSQLGVPASGRISGTIYYLAPEVITGGFIDEGTDLYSLGVIAYELLTGSRPFTGSRHNVLKGHLKVKPEAPSKLRHGIPARVDDLVMKLLEKDKDKRYRNTQELLEDLLILAGREKPIETVEQKQGYIYSSKLIGRDKELKEFRQVLEKLEHGKGGSIFIGAPAGLGKTRLMNEMKTMAELEEIHTVFPERRVSGGRVFGLIEELVHQLTPLIAPDKKEDEEFSLTPAIDKLKNLLKDEEAGAKQDEIVKELKELFSALTAKSPLALFLDDLQWVDLKSLQVLNEILRMGTKHRIYIVCGFRNDEVDKTSPLWHTVEEKITRYLELLPLTFYQTSLLIDNLLYPTEVSSSFKDYCFRNSGGNVFDLLEFMRHLVTEGHLTLSGNKWLEPVNIDEISLSETLEDRMIKRINSLGEKIRGLAEAASILQDDLNLESWFEISGYSTDEFYNSIDLLMQNQVMVRVENDYQFSHDKIQNILYINLSEADKKELHKKAAEFFETKIEQENQKLINIIARHYVKSGEKQKAVEFSLKAAALAEKAGADWEAFAHFKNAVLFLEETPDYPDQDTVLLNIYEKTAKFSSAAWIDALTCLGWIGKAIEHYEKIKDIDKVFDLSLSYVVNSAITSNYRAAREKIAEVIEVCKVEKGSLTWAILFGAGVCLVDWYQGFQMDCFNNAVAAIEIFEKQLDTIPKEAWPAYSWSVFWRDKARAYLGEPVILANIQKIRNMADEGKSDLTIYWHSLTAVIARYAMSGRHAQMQEWEHIASQLSRDMGKIYWFECWISHSYLYAALDYGEFLQLENHIARVQASPDPYQVRLAFLFRGRLRLIEGKYREAEENLKRFLEMEEKSPDNSLLEGYIYLAATYLQMGRSDEARELIEEGSALALEGKLQNPLYQMQFNRLKAEFAISLEKYIPAEQYLEKASELAEQLDNPIQKGFIHKTKGLMLLKRGEKEQGLEELEKAKEWFLSINNKYQAGQVLMVIESQTLPSLKGTVSMKSGEGKDLKTDFEGIEDDTRDEQSVDKHILQKKTVSIHSGSITDVEKTEMDQTVTDV